MVIAPTSRPLRRLLQRTPSRAGPSPARRWPAAALALGLVLAQLGLATHELDHLFHHADAPCGVCIVATGLGAPLPAAAAAAVPAAEATAAPAPVPGFAPLLLGHRPQAARAPPAGATDDST